MDQAILTPELHPSHNKQISVTFTLLPQDKELL